MVNVCTIKITSTDTNVDVKVSGSLFASNIDRINILCTLADAINLDAEDVVKVALIMKLGMAPKCQNGTSIQVADLRKILGKEEDE